MHGGRPRVYILCGLPFAGKSTLARQLAAALDLEHVEIDRINTTRGVGLDGAPVSQADWEATYSESFRQVELQLARGRSVIYDATNYTRDQREQVRRITASAGGWAITIFVDVPQAEAHRRWKENRASGQRYDVRDEDFANVVDNFEPPDDHEGDVIRLGGVQPFDDLLARLVEIP